MEITVADVPDRERFEARTEGGDVVPMCPYIAKWLEKHTEYDDIVARTTRKVR